MTLDALKKNADGLAAAFAVIALALALQIEWWRAFLVVAACSALFVVVLRVLASGVQVSVRVTLRRPPDDEDDPDEDEIDEEPMPPPEQRAEERVIWN